MSNMEKIENGIYLVRTQAGLVRAIKDCFGSDIVMEVWGYPKSYPSVVSLAMWYMGYDYVECTSVHVNKLLEKIKDA